MDELENQSPEAELPVEETGNEVQTATITKDVDASSVKFSDFISARNDKPSEAPSEEKKVEDKKVEVDKDEEPEVKAATEVVTEPKQIDKQKQARDYSIFDEADRPLFQKMSNDSFNKMKELYLENKKLKSQPAPTGNQLPPSYYDHPESYTLTPEYRQSAFELSLAEQIKDHWRQQEINIKHDGKWQNVSIDEKTGKLVVSEAKDATKEDELLVGKEVDFSKDQYSKIRNKFDGVVTGYKAKIEKATSAIKNAEERLFKGFDDEKHPTKPIQDAIRNALPSEFHSSPLLPLLVKTGTALQISNTRINELNAELAKLKGIKTDAAKAQPTKANFVAGDKSAGQVKFSDYARARE